MTEDIIHIKFDTAEFVARISGFAGKLDGLIRMAEHLAHLVHDEHCDNMTSWRDCPDCKDFARRIAEVRPVIDEAMKLDHDNRMARDARRGVHE